MNKNSNIFDRIEFLAQKRGFHGVIELAKRLGYSSAEKIYRLGRDENAKPSYDIISDLTNLFEDLNVRWLISGKGEPFVTQVDPKVDPEVDPDGVNPEVKVKVNPDVRAAVRLDLNEPEVSYGSAKKKIAQLEAELDRLKAANSALMQAFRAVGEGKGASSHDLPAKGSKSS